MSKKGFLVVLSAPSGCGKDTVAHKVSEIRNDCYIAISATSREKRLGEIEGVNYYYKTNEEFEQLIKDKKLLEYAKFADNYYGTLLSEVERGINSGKICILIIEVQGAERVMKLRPDCVSIFLLPPSIEELERRLRSRNTDSEDSIIKRLGLSNGEIACAKSYDYNVVNDDLEDAVNEINNIFCKELERVNAQK